MKGQPLVVLIIPFHSEQLTITEEQDLKSFILSRKRTMLSLQFDTFLNRDKLMLSSATFPERPIHKEFLYN